jgi:iron-sulfur cluster assembly protein
MIQVTDAAAKKIKANLEKRGKGIAIRIGIKTTGCSGLAYMMEYVDELTLDDVLLSDEKTNTVIVTDPKSLPMVAGITVDYVRQGLNEGFEFINPLEKDRCGCGESFRI